MVPLDRLAVWLRTKISRPRPAEVCQLPWSGEGARRVPRDLPPAHPSPPRGSRRTAGCGRVFTPCLTRESPFEGKSQPRGGGRARMRLLDQAAVGYIVTV